MAEGDEVPEPLLAERDAEDAAYHVARTQSREANQVAKERAIRACAEPHKALLQCYERSWFPTCSEENDAFWECYRRERGFAKHRIHAALDSARDVLVPPSAGASQGAQGHDDQ